jgi:hypothetical protein
MTLLAEEKCSTCTASGPDYARRYALHRRSGLSGFSRQSPYPGFSVCFALPLFIRRRIAARMRADSKAANSSKSLEIMDVNPQAVVDALERHQVQWLIHGHTHRPAVHPLEANGNRHFASSSAPGTAKGRWSKSAKTTLS